MKKYSHTVVLAHYSSLGLIDLPNDQYIAYLKTCPTLGSPSHASRHRGRSSGTQGSITPSTGYSSRYRLFEEPASTSRSVTDRRGYGTGIRRNVIVESDEGSEDEQVILHGKNGPVGPPRHFRKKVNGHRLRTERNKIPSESTYTGRSSSETSDRVVFSQNQPHTLAQARSKHKTSSPSVINLNDYEAEPGSGGQEAVPAQSTDSHAPPSSALKADSIAAQTKVVNRTAAASSTQDHQIDSLGVENEPDFDGFSDGHIPESTATGLGKSHPETISAVSSRQFFKSTLSTKPVLSSADRPPTLPKRVDSAPGFHRDTPKQRQLQDSWSSESSLNAGSEDMTHLTAAPRDVVSSRQQKPLRTKQGKTNLASRDANVSEDTIDPSFFEESGGTSRRPSTSPTERRLTALYSNPPPSTSRASQQHSRPSSDHAPPNPDFWRGLEEMLSDSDASAAFPPDIAKSKLRDDNFLPVAKADNSLRTRTDDVQPKRPTTAPAPRTGSQEALKKDEPLPDGRSKITVTSSEGLEKQRVDREPTTVQLVDTSTQKKAKTFLRKLRKKNYDVKRP